MKTFPATITFLALIVAVSCSSVREGEEAQPTAQAMEEEVIIEPTQLAPDAFLAAVQADSTAVLIDVRTADEFAAGTIPGATNIDYMHAGFSDALDKLDRTKNYYVFCEVGGRSAKAVSAMSDKGFKSVTELAGGYAAVRPLLEKP